MIPFISLFFIIISVFIFIVFQYTELPEFFGHGFFIFTEL